MTKVVPSAHKNKNLLDIAGYVKYEAVPNEDVREDSVQGDPDRHSSLTSRRREYLMKQPIKNHKAQKFFLKARVKLRGLLLWKKIREDINEFGISSHTMNKAYIALNVNQLQQYGPCFTGTLQNELIPQYMILPNSSFKKYWNMLIFLLIFYVFIGMPWVAAFEDSHPWTVIFIFEALIDLLFFLDIIFTLNTAYIDQDEKLIYNRRQIAINYMKGMFFIDLFSVVPFYLIDLSNSRPNRSNTYIRMLRITKIIRLFRASKILTIIEKITDSDTIAYWQDIILNYRGTSRLIAAVFVILIMAHINACMWYFFAKIDDLGPETWVYRGGYMDDDNQTLYLRGLYFTFTIITTVGFGDIHANTITEMLICVILMLFGIGFYSFLVGTLSSLISSIDAKAVRISSKLDSIEKFVNENKLPEALLRQMKRFIKNNGENEAMQEEFRLDLIAQMPKSFRYDIAMNMFDALPQNIFFFKRQDMAFIIDIVPRLNYLETRKNEMIYSKGEHPTSVYFIGEGRVTYIYSKSKIGFKTMIEGSYFGEGELMEKSYRKFSAVCECACRILVMNEELLKHFLEKFPSIGDSFKDSARIKNLRDSENLQEIIDVLEVVEVRKEVELENLCGKKRIRNKAMMKAKKERLIGAVKNKVNENKLKFGGRVMAKLAEIEQEIEELEGFVSQIKSH